MSAGATAEGLEEEATAAEAAAEAPTEVGEAKEAAAKVPGEEAVRAVDGGEDDGLVGLAAVPSFPVWGAR